MSTPILATKLFVPPPRPKVVLRPRLIECLNKGLQSKLTLISAPAGFGKTTLVGECVSSKRLAAWLSLDAGDNDPTRFLTYLVAALQSLALNEPNGIAVNFGEGVLSVLQSPQPLPVESILTPLLNEISTIPDNFILVLDDYHVIEAQSVDDALTFMLDHLPPQMHLVIATREDPNLPLARLRVRGQLTELRSNDLRFSTSEAAVFLNQVMGLNLLEKEISALETRTEGWIAGLQLAAISMRGHKDTAGFIKSFTGSHHFVLDYLIEEVIEQQSQSVQNFLLKTAILDRMSGSLCAALTDQDNSQATLEMLERSNLFMVPLDNERRWYRYHHLFADLLDHRLRQTFPDQISELHQRASEWYEQKDRPSDAIRHALAAEDFERAARLAELAWPAMSGSFQSIEWLGWVKTLPDDLVRARPVMCVAYAWAFLNAGDLEAAEARLLAAERWLDPEADLSDRPEPQSTKMVVVDQEQFRSLPLSLATARAYHAQAVGNVSGTLKYARQVLDLLPEGNSQWRGDVTALLGLAYWTSGDLEAAHRTLSNGLARMDPLDIIIGTFVLAEMKTILGQLQEAILTCEHALQLATKQGGPLPLGTEDVYTAIGELHRERGDLEAAALDLQTAQMLGEQVELPDWQYRWCMAQARLKESQGDWDGALDLLDEAERLYVRTPLPKVRPIPALKASVWVKQEKLAEALGWIHERGLSDNDELSYMREFEHLTLARVLIAQYTSSGEDGAIHEAVGLLERLLQAAQEGGRMGSVIQILVLQTIAYEAQDDTSSALLSLERALALAEPEGYGRIFVDEGSLMARVLYEAISRGIAPDYVRRLLAAFPAGEGEQTALSKSQAPGFDLIEPLSEREIEVLQLISEGLTNPEIASRLFLALNTVKVHTRNINGKLGVHNRTLAVTKGRALGILPSI